MRSSVITAHMGCHHSPPKTTPLSGLWASPYTEGERTRKSIIILIFTLVNMTLEHNIKYHGAPMTQEMPSEVSVFVENESRSRVPSVMSVFFTLHNGSSTMPAATFPETMNSRANRAMARSCTKSLYCKTSIICPSQDAIFNMSLEADEFLKSRSRAISKYHSFHVLRNRALVRFRGIQVISLTFRKVPNHFKKVPTKRFSAVSLDEDAFF